MSEEQLEKLSRRLSTMSPEDLAKFAAGFAFCEGREGEERSGFQRGRKDARKCRGCR